MNGLVHAGIVVAAAGKVRLRKRDELPAQWSQASGSRLTLWDVVQHLVRTLEGAGESGAATMLRRVGPGIGEAARQLAYRLYIISERSGWASEALAYNSLVTAWPELTRIATADPAGVQQLMEV